MSKLSSIKSFLEPKEMAIAGVSRNPRKFGRMVYDHLKKREFRLCGINPNTDSINGDPCFHSVADLPAQVSRLLVVTPKNQTLEIVQAAITRGIKNIWIQQTSETPEALELAAKNNIDLISKECIMKFAEPVDGVHKFHRFFSRLFGGYPK
jgi:predicted CoA-binding protein